MQPSPSAEASYVFPVSTSQQRYGILAVTKDRGQEFVPEDVELLRSLASHVAVALECALARDSAEGYQRQVAKERDRLRLLLEINNHIVSKLDINELFGSGIGIDPAATSIMTSRDFGSSINNRTSLNASSWISPAARVC